MALQGPPLPAFPRGSTLSPSHRLYKTSICRDWVMTNGHCPRGGICSFAHGQEELREPPGYRTSICQFHRRGECSKGAECHLAHSLEELRTHKYELDPSAFRRPWWEKLSHKRRDGKAFPALLHLDTMDASHQNSSPDAPGTSATATHTPPTDNHQRQHDHPFFKAHFWPDSNVIFADRRKLFVVVVNKPVCWDLQSLADSVERAAYAKRIIPRFSRSLSYCVEGNDFAVIRCHDEMSAIDIINIKELSAPSTPTATDVLPSPHQMAIVLSPYDATHDMLLLKDPYRKSLSGVDHGCPEIIRPPTEPVCDMVPLPVAKDTFLSSAVLSGGDGAGGGGGEGSVGDGGQPARRRRGKTTSVPLPPWRTNKEIIRPPTEPVCDMVPLPVAKDTFLSSAVLSGGDGAGGGGGEGSVGDGGQPARRRRGKTTSVPLPPWRTNKAYDVYRDGGGQQPPPCVSEDVKSLLEIAKIVEGIGQHYSSDSMAIHSMADPITATHTQHHDKHAAVMAVDVSDEAPRTPQPKAASPARRVKRESSTPAGSANEYDNHKEGTSGRLDGRHYNENNNNSAAGVCVGERSGETSGQGDDVMQLWDDGRRSPSHNKRKRCPTPPPRVCTTARFDVSPAPKHPMLFIPKRMRLAYE
ncbi:unnamed protein product [Vitrella brassicaformis CCMP3155]|uniref:C3H1-type domain-containing protein n=1 Tax=Vitrella brassicaformis (strain CCMP3155) TaxID=1169540 RepID=A0A0G4GI82_VITBC|nr:unnamed protein product [Vitrella brassicaformis CCMP3155]|eukprot:CEM29566.1 unnamed protein product [Vitrella brassicaformis CCMP3155]